MTYIISGLNGSLQALNDLLSVIKPKNRDDIYLLGNILRDGADGIAIINKALDSENIFTVAAKCEFLAAKYLPVIANGGKNADDSVKTGMALWLKEGGLKTAEAFMKLQSDDEKQYIIEYLKDECFLTEEIKAGGRTFAISVRGFGNFSADRDIYDYSAEELLDGDYDPTCDFYKSNKSFVVCGDLDDFTPDEGFEDKIYKNNNVILMNHAENRRPCALRLDDLSEYYIG